MIPNRDIYITLGGAPIYLRVKCSTPYSMQLVNSAGRILSDIRPNTNLWTHLASWVRAGNPELFSDNP